MGALPKPALPDAAQITSYLSALAFRGCQYAKASVLSASVALLRQDDSALASVQESERELDRIDREFDERIAGALAQATPQQARELLAHLKSVLDLERVTDLVAGFASRAHSVGARLEPEDITELSRMLALLGSMLTDIYDGLSRRDAERSLAVIRADSELDRLRNLVLIRHLDGQSPARLSESIQVVAMAVPGARRRSREERRRGGLPPRHRPELAPPAARPRQALRADVPRSPAQAARPRARGAG